MASTKFLRIAQLARLNILPWAHSTIIRMAKDGELLSLGIPHYNFDGEIRFIREEVEEWVESCRVHPKKKSAA